MASQTEQWMAPEGFRQGVSMRVIRKMAKGLPMKWKDAELYKQDVHDVYFKIWDNKMSQSEHWKLTNQWLEARGFEWSVRRRIPLALLRAASPSALPANLRDTPEKVPVKEFPPESDDWWYYPLNWAPPTNKPEIRKYLPKSVPEWGPEYMLSWHGTSMYGLSSCLFSGFIAPSEPDVEGHNTGAGRGAYTSFSFMGAARHGVPMLLDPEKANCLRAVLLVAIPGHEGKGGLMQWTTDSSKPKGQKWSLQPSVGHAAPASSAASSSSTSAAASSSDWRLVRALAREDTSQAEPDWTNWSEECKQETSSRAYPLGFALLSAHPSEMKKYNYEGSRARLHVGFDEKLEMPPARPKKAAPSGEVKWFPDDAFSVNLRQVRNRKKKARYAQNKKDREEAQVGKKEDREEAQVGKKEDREEAQVEVEV